VFLCLGERAQGAAGALPHTLQTRESVARLHGEEGRWGQRGRGDYGVPANAGPYLAVTTTLFRPNSPSPARTAAWRWEKMAGTCAYSSGTPVLVVGKKSEGYPTSPGVWPRAGDRVQVIVDDLIPDFSYRHRRSASVRFDSG